MQGKKEKPKIRFTRNDDGSLGVPRVGSQKSEDLVEIWGQQKASLQIPRLSLKEEARSIKQSFKAPNKSINTVTSTQKPTRLQPIKGASTKLIAVTVTIPALRVPQKIVPKKKWQIVSALLGVLVVVFVVGVLIFKPSSEPSGTNGEVKGEVTNTIATNVTPEFPTLTPFGDGVEGLGGFAKISPEGSPPVYAFRDNINSVPIKVSQQSLPDALRTDQVNKLKELAEGFNAKTPLEIGDNTAYIGASVNGAQSVVYIKGENLVLIASDATIPNANWVEYIGNLKF